MRNEDEEPATVGKEVSIDMEAHISNGYQMTTVILTGVFLRFSKEIWTPRCSNFLTSETGPLAVI